MATVTNTVVLPDGTPPAQCTVTVDLVGSTTRRIPGWVTATGDTILSVSQPVATNGTWSIDLVPNADITPTGTVYRVTEYADRHTYTHHITVTSGGGELFDLLDDPPATIESSALAAFKANFAGGVAGQVFTSLTATTFGWRSPKTLGPTYVVLGDETSETWESWPWQLTLRNQRKLTLTQHVESSVFSATAATMRTIFARYLSPTLPSFVVLCLGYSDLVSATVDTFATNMAALVADVEAMGCTPVLTTVVPRGAKDTSGTATFKARASSASMWLQTFAAANGYHIVDFYSLLVDPNTGALAPKYTSDGQHINQRAHRDMADTAAAVLLPHVRAWRSGAVQFDGDTSNLLNGSLPDADGTSVPDNWTLSGAGTTAAVVPDPRFGNGRAVQLTSVDPSALGRLLSPNLNPTGAEISAGDICAVSFSYAIEERAGISLIAEEAGLGAFIQVPTQMTFFSVHSTPGGVQDSDPNLTYSDGQPVGYSSIVPVTYGASTPLLDFTGLVYFPVNATPSANYDRSTVKIEFRVSASVGVRFRARIGNISVRNLTRLGADVGGTVAGSWNWQNSWSSDPEYVPVGS